MDTLEDSEVRRKLERLTLLADFGDDPEECVDWLGTKNRKGYGRVWWDGRCYEAHRASYELFIGAIPPGLVIDHVCRNRSCINPTHLEPVTAEENYRRGDGVFGPPPFERCRSGQHLMTETRVLRGKTKLPRCGECERERARNYGRAKRAA